MSVLTTPRRITLYWLLLLLPTIAIGAVAVFLLRREQARAAERSAYADEARRAAVTSRARLIVENIELLVGDVQTALLDGLAAESPATLDAFLDRWEQGNPLVRSTFRATATGQLLRPNPRAAGDDVRGFARRYFRAIGDAPPWATDGAPTAKKMKDTDRVVEDSLSGRDVSKNVAQVQSARRDVQELLRTQNSYASAGNAPMSASKPALVEANQRASEALRRKAASADRDAAQRTETRAPGVAAAPLAERAGDSAAVLAKSDRAERRGWIPANIDGRLHLLGWVQPPGGTDVRGVELELVALISKLGGTLPADLPPGEGYVLRDNQQRVLHQVGLIPREGEPLIRLPVAATLLPGWQVDAYLRAPDNSYAGSSAGLLTVGMLLVAIFLAAILSGGWLLLWQARRSEAEAAQKTSFVANVSHEFKTPLTTIRLYAELLEQGRVRDANQGNEYLRTIGRETQRLARLVNNALDFSRLEQGRKKYARESLDLTEELPRFLQTHAPRIQESGVTLRTQAPPEPVRITTDRDAVEQIVLNLIDNACKYAATGGELVVTLAARAAGGAEIRVADRGPGVPLEHRERIFEKFHRVDETLTAEKTGAGLGLSIARQLARGLGGDLQYQPRDGGGAEFILQLP